ncbi:Murein DD-endopeptidase MepM and murein hydrolase activator NlpD, contain LysM domain [Parasphingorhabdus marina DSM 22363]|uniref:Murein DD-endopeptidase MepM and murein hydrolase activator NlpD, contain LysM domain n=2 Tax=Parasphingorhabdus marina TaxID=394732 RepID=A0A1N6H673_9SPHN|nr:Murein DD-endopeptidase MepM and murein hydrolase activator NlpD, contain LysM domain [Parasphingorhabdus marina DSM 22363]
MLGAPAAADLDANGSGATASESSDSAAVEASAFRQATRFGFSGQAIQGGVMLGDAPEGTRSLTLDGQPVKFDADGKFIIAFNRDAGQSSQLVATLDSGETVRKFFSVAPRKWKIEHVALNRRGRTASAAFMKRRAPELAQIGAARAANSSSEGWRQTFIWPAKGRISGMFGNQRIYNGTPGSYHSGIDIAAKTGTYYVAPADGVVTLATNRPFSLEGNLLIIDHGMGLNSAFLHSSEILVKTGQVVKRGEPIGRIGATGSATGPHLHWSMKWNKARIDPILLTGPMN